jgi:hypothetical protein
VVSKLTANSDISANSNLYVQADTSLNGQLYVQGKINTDSDISTNSSINIKSASIYVDLSGSLVVNNSGNQNSQVELQSGSSSWSSTSDMRLKTNILPIENSLDKILQIGGYTFNYKTDLSNQHVGVIAQEVEQILPQAVCTNSQGYLTVKYTDLIPLLINGMQELKKEILELKSEILELKKS